MRAYLDMMTSREVLSLRISKVFRRTLMFLLFIGALLATMTSISNVSLGDLQDWLHVQGIRSSSEPSWQPEYRHVTMKPKTFNVSRTEETQISNEKAARPKTLEEAIQLEQYPSRKVVATGYTAGVESTGKTSDHPEYGITYSGVKVKRDLYSTIAADLNIFPIGTILYIPDYGYGVVADKGGAIQGDKIDLFYDTVEDVFAQWGKRELDVYIIEMGDGELTEEHLNQLNENEALQVYREQINKS